MLNLSKLTPTQLQLGLTIASKLGVSMPMLSVVTQALNDKTVFNDDGSLNDEKVQVYGDQLVNMIGSSKSEQNSQNTHNHAQGIGCPSCGYWISI